MLSPVASAWICRPAGTVGVSPSFQPTAFGHAHRRKQILLRLGQHRDWAHTASSGRRPCRCKRARASPMRDQHGRSADHGRSPWRGTRSAVTLQPRKLSDQEEDRDDRRQRDSGGDDRRPGVAAVDEGVEDRQHRRDDEHGELEPEQSARCGRAICRSRGRSRRPAPRTSPPTISQAEKFGPLHERSRIIHVVREQRRDQQRRGGPSENGMEQLRRARRLVSIGPVSIGHARSPNK